VLESFVTKERDKAAALRFIKKALKRHGRPKTIVTDGLRSYSAALTDMGAAERQETLVEQPRREQPPTVPTTGAGDGPLPPHEDFAEIQFGPCFRPQPLRSGAPPRQPTRIPRETLSRTGGVAVSHAVTAGWVWAQCA